MKSTSACANPDCVRLLDRTTRRISRTDAGETLYRYSSRIMSDIAEAELLVSEFREEPRGTLKVTSPIMIGLHKVIPLLPGFLRRHRHIKVQLDLSDDLTDPALAEHDLGLRWAEQPASALIITRIAESRQILCAAPSYLKAYGEPTVPRDLLRHNCVMMNRLGLATNDWDFIINGEAVSLRVTGNFVVNGGHGNYEAVIAGLGIGRMTDLRVLQDISDGRLRRILRKFEPPGGTPIYAVYKSGSLVPPKIRLFVDYLRGEMKAA